MPSKLEPGALEYRPIVGLDTQEGDIIGACDQMHS